VQKKILKKQEKKRLKRKPNRLFLFDISTYILYTRCEGSDSMKKGFTLVELLAVIVILAIVALIAVPVIYDQVEKSKIGAAESSCYALEQSATNFYTLSLTKNKEADEYLFECNGGVCVSPYGPLELRGKIPTAGKFKIKSDGTLEIVENLIIDGYSCRLKDKNFICE